MLVRTVSHRYADLILGRHFATEWAELQSTLGGVKVPGKASIHHARTMQAQVARGLLAHGWEGARPFIESSQATGLASTLRKGGAVLVTEFGAAAYVYRALVTFLALESSGESDVGILVLPTKQTAGQLGRGRATWEQAIELVPYLRASIHLPIAIVGLEPDSSR